MQLRLLQQPAAVAAASAACRGRARRRAWSQLRRLQPLRPLPGRPCPTASCLQGAGGYPMGANCCVAAIAGYCMYTLLYACKRRTIVVRYVFTCTCCCCCAARGEGMGGAVPPPVEDRFFDVATVPEVESIYGLPITYLAAVPPAAALGGPTDAASLLRRPASAGAAAAAAAACWCCSGTDSGCDTTGVGELNGGSAIVSSRLALPGPPVVAAIARRGVDGICCPPYPAGTLPGPPPPPPPDMSWWPECVECTEEGCCEYI
ncbi:hypothetical protein PRIPAC_81058 [Pristionchus pacificus]|nr:hypothetical protein PRIPAC_81058 [Pristionchus pacificus]|eukprot:PDM70440.1 hypothetical protein PRIPAC_46686 [Pristionchus pacificus]